MRICETLGKGKEKRKRKRKGERMREREGEGRRKRQRGREGGKEGRSVRIRSTMKVTQPQGREESDRSQQ